MLWILIVIICIGILGGILFTPLNQRLTHYPLGGIFYHAFLSIILFLMCGVAWQTIPLQLMLILLALEYGMLYFIKRKGMGISKYVNSRLAITLVYMMALFLLVFPIPNMTVDMGDFAVGNWRIVIESSDRDETFKPDQAVKRQFTVRMYYPVIEGSGPRSKWLEGGRAAVEGIETCYGIPSFFISHLPEVSLQALNSRKIIKTGVKTPVIIISHGINSSPDQHARLAQILASRGNFVAVINHTYSAYSTSLGKNLYVLGKTAPTSHIQYVHQKINAERVVTGVQYADIVEVIKALDTINQGKNDKAFEQALDLSDITVVGHQIGGGAALVALSEIPFVKSAVLLNPVVEQLPKKYMLGGVNKAFTTLVTEDYLESNNAVYLESIINNSHQEETFKVAVGKDLDFTDVPLLTPLFRVSGLSAGKASQTELLKLQADLIDKTVSKYAMGSYFKTMAEYLKEAYPQIESYTPEN